MPFGIVIRNNSARVRLRDATRLPRPSDGLEHLGLLLDTGLQNYRTQKCASHRPQRWVTRKVANMYEDLMIACVAL
jgi:hypothetical protein